MSELKIVGKFIAKSDYKQITEKFGLENFWVDIDGKYPTQAQFQVNNKALALEFAKGAELEISFNVQGRKWEKDGRSGFAQNLVAWRVLDLTSTNSEPASTTEKVDDDLPF